jgi:uncharacterized repeat protein (TIGR03803 family)
VRLAAKQSQAGAPLGAISIDPLGNLYTTFSAGGQSGLGGVFKLGPYAGSRHFSFDGCNGMMPHAGVLLDKRQAAIYGTTLAWGTTGFGTVFKITASGQESVLYSFCSQPNCVDGSQPVASVVEGTAGTFYETTRHGGTNNKGVAYQVIQSSPRRKVPDRPQWRVVLPTTR